MEKIAQAIAQPFVIDGHSLNVGVSIGVSQFPKDGSTAEQLIDAADRAMYEKKQSKGAGRR